MKKLLLSVLIFIFSSAVFVQTAQCGKVKTINSTQTLKLRPQLRSSLTGIWPRLLMNREDLILLRERLKKEPELRKAAIPATLPKPRLEATGSVDITPEFEKLQNAAFLWRVTGEERFRENVIAFLPMVKKVIEIPVTLHKGTNAHDLNAGFTLRWLSLTYDWLHDSWATEDLMLLRKAIAIEASAVYDEMQGYRDFTYEQNHGYIPVVGLGLAAFVLWGEDERAPIWADYARNYMDISTRTLGSDGFYYEGPGYYSYAFPWQTLYTAALLHVTGEDWTTRPIFQNLELYIAHCTLPGRGFLFDFGDWGSFKGQKYYGISWPDRTTLTPLSSRMNLLPLLALDHYSATDKTRSSVLDWLLTGNNSLDLTLLGNRPFPFKQKDPDPSILPASHYFPDSEALFWRSSWSDADATAVMFKCGPPHGHHAAPMVNEYPLWRMNSGHVHPDAGQFLIWSHGKFIAGDTGYTGKKYTQEHNSLLIDGQGQWQDGRYHVYLGLDYKRLNGLHLENVWHNNEVMAATAVLDSAYNPDLKLQKVRRHFFLVKGKWLLIKDEVTANEPRSISWLWHTDQQVTSAGENRWYLENGKATATLIALTPSAQVKIEPAVVLAYGGVPENGEPMQRGWRIQLNSPKSASNILWHAMILNPESNNSASAKQISSEEIYLNDNKEEAVLGIKTMKNGHIIWSYKINRGKKKHSTGK